MASPASDSSASVATTTAMPGSAGATSMAQPSLVADPQAGRVLAENTMANTSEMNSCFMDQGRVYDNV